MNSKRKNKRSSASPKTLLLVDDDTPARQMIGRVLADEGYHVLHAANGAEALELAATNAIRPGPA
jgi:CheY-like chemotaxis protein